MGREIRRVPPDWQHPKELNKYNGEMHYTPLFDQSYEEAKAEWLEGLRRWDLGETRDYMTNGWKPKAEYQLEYDYWEDAGDPPERKMHRPHWTPEQATAYQVYETVSEGTPISPVLPTRDALLNWLMNDGFGMGIEPRTLRLTREQAERFIEAGSAPSLVADAAHGVRDGVIAMADTERR